MQIFLVAAGWNVFIVAIVGEDIERAWLRNLLFTISALALLAYVVIVIYHLGNIPDILANIW
jgi:hypothetical protein